MPFTYPLFPRLTRAGLRMLTIAGAATLASAMSEPVNAQTAPLASATIQTTSTGAVNSYALTLTDSASSASPIGTFWFSWVPGEDFMSALPTNITSPAGWTDNITGGGAGDGYAIQWLAGAGAAVSIGTSLSGFGFSSTETSAQLGANSPSHPGTPTLTTFTYSGAPFSDSGTEFVVSQVSTPEPASIAALAPIALLLCRRSRKQ
jgi:hypothetical protein